MKKLIILMLVLALSAVALLGCEKEETAPDTTDSAENTAVATEPVDETTEEPADTKATPDETFAPIENLEPVATDFSSSDIGTRYSSKGYKYLKANHFKKDDANYNWYEFYNACVAGELNVASEDAVSYINKCLDDFSKYGLEDEATQARALLAAAESAN